MASVVSDSVQPHIVCEIRVQKTQELLPAHWRVKPDHGVSAKVLACRARSYSLAVGPWDTSCCSVALRTESEMERKPDPCLENPRDGRAWWAAVYAVAQSQTRLKQLGRDTESDTTEATQQQQQQRKGQPSPWVGPGKPNLPLGWRGKAGGCARVTAGPKRPHLGPGSLLT